MPIKDWVFRTTPTFRKSFAALTADQKAKAKDLFRRFKADPLAPELRSHKINRLTSLRRQLVRGIHVEGDLIVVFIVQDNQVISLDIGKHAIYR